MSIIKQILLKFKKPEDYILEDFEKNYKHNERFADKEFKKIHNSVTKFWDRDEIYAFIPDMDADYDVLSSILLNQIKSDIFSLNFADVIMFARLYAVNYIATNRGKTAQEIISACESLCSMVDYLNFNFQSHINFETDLRVDYENGEYIITDNEYSVSLMEMVNYVNSVLVKLSDGIYKRDRNAVYSAYCELCNNTIFDLQKYKDEYKEDSNNCKDSVNEDNSSNSTTKELGL